MKAVLDESVPQRLARVLQIQGLDVSAFPDVWKGAKNGRLLALLEASPFECLLTCDKNLRFQQTIATRPIALVVLPRQRFDDLLPYLEEISRVLQHTRIGDVAVVAQQAEG